MPRDTSESRLAGMRRSGRVIAEIRDALAAAVAPGKTTRELGELARQLIEERGVENAFLGYRGYPGTFCISVNEEVVHGIPGDRIIQLGDAVSIDVGVRVDGFIGDCATTVLVGVTDPAVIGLVMTAEKALMAGIMACRAGNRVGDISHAIQEISEAGGCSVVRDFVGHGVGRKMHEEPQIPNYGRPNKGPELRPGMTLCLEPMINLGGPEVRVLSDGWTAVTCDGCVSAHVEHMIAVTDGEPEVLTL